MTKNMSKIIPSSALFTNPSPLKGSARLADLFGQLDEYNFETKQNIDRKALGRDWKVIGIDIASAVNAYGSTQTPKKKK